MDKSFLLKLDYILDAVQVSLVGKSKDVYLSSSFLCVCVLIF